jgi:hypothetical protein
MSFRFHQFRSECPQWSVSTGWYGSLAPFQCFRERTLKSEAPITSSLHGQRPDWPRSGRLRQFTCAAAFRPKQSFALLTPQVFTNGRFEIPRTRTFDPKADIQRLLSPLAFSV